MPYSFPGNIPSAVKNLPKGAQKIYVEVFNSTFDESEDDTKARQAAWGAVKNKYKKAGEEWVSKNEKESVEPEEENEEVEFDESEETKEDKVELDTTYLTEAVFDDATKTAVVTVIKEGWSKNYTGGKQRYYTARAVADVSSLLSTSKKLFIDHSKTERSMSEWTATCTESWVVDDSGKKIAKAKVDFTDNPNTVWLYTEAKKHPSEVGLSIHGSGEIRVGKVGTKDAAIVEAVPKLKSVDFVTEPAAGGEVEKVIMSSVDSDRALFILNESYKTLDQMVKDREKYDQPFVDFNRVMYALSDFLSSLMYASEISSDNVGDKVTDAVNMFSEKIKDILKTIKKNQEPEKKESVKHKESKMTLEELKASDPEAYNKLMEQANLLAKNEAEKEVKEKVETLETEKTQLTEAKEKAENDLKEAADKLAVFENEKALREKKEFVNTKLAENKIDDKVSDEFKTLLEGMENEVAEKLIVDTAKTMVNLSEGKVRGFGAPPKKEEEEPKKLSFGELYFK